MVKSSEIRGDLVPRKSERGAHDPLKTRSFAVKLELGPETGRLTVTELISGTGCNQHKAEKNGFAKVLAHPCTRVWYPGSTRYPCTLLVHLQTNAIIRPARLSNYKSTASYIVRILHPCNSNSFPCLGPFTYLEPRTYVCLPLSESWHLVNRAP